MPSANVLPVKTSVSTRLLHQHQVAKDAVAAIKIDPLLRLSECMELLGSPSYFTVRKWIASGSLRVWRPGNRGQFRCRLSWIKSFLDANEVQPSGGHDAS
jgi:hypothetical protein